MKVSQYRGPSGGWRLEEGGVGVLGCRGGIKLRGKGDGVEANTEEHRRKEGRKEGEQMDGHKTKEGRKEGMELEKRGGFKRKE